MGPGFRVKIVSAFSKVQIDDIPEDESGNTLERFGFETYRTIVTRMEQGLLVYDRQRILGANAKLCSLLNCPAELVVPGADLEKFIQFGAERGDYSASAGLTLQSMRMHIAAGKDYIVERQLPDGRTIRIDCRHDGETGIGTYTDITDAAKEKAVLEATFEAMAQGLLVHDRGTIIASNARLAEVLEIPAELITVGNSWEAIIRYRIERGDYQDGESHLVRAREAFATRREFTVEAQAGSRTLLTECRHRHGMMFVTYTDITDARARELLLQDKEMEVRKLAAIDGLTNLTNRRAFDEDLQTRLDARGPNADQNALALILVDLDRFKPVNDTYGHALGDALLQTLSDRFRGVIRQGDTMARIGGDEFAAIVEVSSESDALKFAGRLRDAAKRPVVVGDTELNVDASVGVAFLNGETNDAESLLMAADLALYAAKEAGRGTVRTYKPELAERAKERYSLEQDLRSALENDEVVLFYQVQRDLHTNKDVGYEALMRWQHPARGLVSPADFIPLAEETGLIVDMGRWALRQAATDFADLDKTTRVAVNVSPVQFVKSDLVADVKAALDESGLEPERLEIEITEDLLIEDTENTLRILSELRELGLSLSLDDFGSGYSSLAYLTQFPFTKLKIDRCFTERMLLDNRSRSLVTSILALASSLGMKVTAEGVETAAQLAMLTDGSCDEAQGYLLGKPVPFTKAFAAK